jgi:hypothetical protein
MFTTNPKQITLDLNLGHQDEIMEINSLVYSMAL